MKFVFKKDEKLDSLVDYILSFKNLEAILLNGELGAGKTTLVSQIAKKLNITKPIVSPTFNTILIYDKLVHIDAYKLTGDLFAYEDYFEDKLVAIEWAKNIKHDFKNYLEINVYFDKDQNHVFEILNKE
ncbi:tRNA (adenosine(37)-N6)-threonylcarbamoyltransferase complex ATPase subunit type 1 TsaE [Mycoplasma struthionis]|uniref:tRNA threonylcarbamoyladenosine biosynthesis protein TsaE n=1 Tax=Mycoplasma struthionis TaxID=538220 RepID=A0A3G8LG14_9MOLU|nr:tRNA (adenosine(37)-N6)-threonylcarbamoyltransferase complex ATPase subunit type 1 TsaE [Mycoplasma struthionis]AZG68603.1 tRNA (adenosine(37)-N6)-threonylcarbamoyltransferase complex ATPase subunit type 1 TsaE [Mycoplasma struthionis]TPI02260.1 tRNA (adenosine(37)-N6)-threonylcarbamoyltransferase complex ATPase subunit type 1 TsaE [Mycoplasma struthionis]